MVYPGLLRLGEQEIDPWVISCRQLKHMAGGTTLECTSTWAAVCSAIFAISLAVEPFLHYLCNACLYTQKVLLFFLFDLNCYP
uniref:Uncharacterized protein n=1 Tax=Rhizophora mucronata TaxID=61149 RepID=A0A2P2IPU6_RHIMU